MSREIVLYIATSLDGFIAKEDNDLQWLIETEGEGDAGYEDMYQSIDTTIMGKKTYDYVMKNSESFPYPEKKCYVFSNSEKGSNEYVEFVNENVIEFTRKLKKQQGSKIWMIGGAGILDAFIKENLIDEYIITVTPHILGSGIPLFKVKNPQIDLILIDTKRYGQFVQMHYKVKQYKK
ncbi:dihydrofolate reductase family protein [Lysinibacillus pakistanensis]|uniref:Dihydrofolate reductase family protein n=1 Tax=Lysinibacillus pakistanensis TaxID=759811 RepID=A0AAX3WZG4_9BACI|nr:dihydrofolate reductase family protein [Lysinibacillus pakistanensis]MDM5232807.1 dihydrofolate reductase family protein [Lysinibacillus pakistanensis]WHY48305.1 dihydrofolate reductase family protein [Lysinibacillus pakistanensis]WHY53318.1 dihydrofolate reductase family protein [Lysinibacillus pakistanensis]